MKLVNISIALLTLWALYIAISATAVKHEAKDLSAAVQADIEAIQSISIALVPDFTAAFQSTQPDMAEEPAFTPLNIDLPEDLQLHAWELCQKYGVRFELFLSLMHHESRFQVEAVGYNRNGTKDTGLMQINDVNRGWLMELGFDIENPYDNMEAAALILGSFYEKGYTDAEVITAYGRGEGGLQAKGIAPWAIEIVEGGEVYAAQAGT